jgi:DNA-nicking Smr family endonuclease
MMRGDANPPAGDDVDVDDKFCDNDTVTHKHHHEWLVHGKKRQRSKKHRAKYTKCKQKRTDKEICTECDRFAKKGKKCLQHRKQTKRKDEYFAKSSYFLPNTEDYSPNVDDAHIYKSSIEKDETLSIKIVDIDGNALPQYYRVKDRNSKNLEKIFRIYSQRVHVPFHLLTFTPASLDMEGVAIIRVSRNVQNQLLRKLKPYKDNNEITIDIKIASLKKIERYTIEEDDKEGPEWLFQEYAKLVGTQIKFVRFKYKERPLFLSRVKNKSASDLGMQNYDKIHAWHITDRTIETSKPSKVQRIEKKKSKQTKRGTKARGKNRVSPKKLPYHHIDMEKKWKQLHSMAISRVFEEAATIFKEIRQKLDALNLERTKPKSKRINIKTNLTTCTTKSIDNPNSEGLRGKAGKTQYAIHVGEVNNLYKSSKKRSKQRKHKTRRNITNENITIDLHGLTAVEAESKLNESLPVWVKIAMHGSYPFVTRVNIICGGGAQILSEVVEKWIKQNEKVSNAPKKR